MKKTDVFLEIDIDNLYSKVEPIMDFVRESTLTLKKMNVPDVDIIVAMPFYMSRIIEWYNIKAGFNSQTRAVTLFGCKINSDHFEHKIVVYYKGVLFPYRPNMIFSLDLKL